MFSGGSFWGTNFGEERSHAARRSFLGFPKRSRAARGASWSTKHYENKGFGAWHSFRQFFGIRLPPAWVPVAAGLGAGLKEVLKAIRKQSEKRGRNQEAIRKQPESSQKATRKQPESNQKATRKQPGSNQEATRKQPESNQKATGKQPESN